MLKFDFALVQVGSVVYVAIVSLVRSVVMGRETGTLLLLFICHLIAWKPQWSISRNRRKPKGWILRTTALEKLKIFEIFTEIGSAWVAQWRYPLMTTKVPETLTFNANFRRAGADFSPSVRDEAYLFNKQLKSLRKFRHGNIYISLLWRNLRIFRRIQLRFFVSSTLSKLWPVG